MGVVERHHRDAGPPLGGAVAPRVVDQNLTHQVRGNRHEMGAALEVWLRLLANQPQVRLVYKCRRLQGVSRPLPAQVGGREPMELAIESLGNLAQRGVVAAPPVPQQDRDRNRSRLVHVGCGRHYRRKKLAVGVWAAFRALVNGGDMQISISKSNISPNVPLVPGIGGLEAVYEDIRRGRIAAGLEDLFDDLSVRREDAPEAWPEFARTCLHHPLRRLLHQDPFTYRAFSKPRGYAGDAVMMDYIYGLGEASTAARGATPLGRAIFAHMATRPSASAVRYRRHLLATLIDRTAARGGDAVFALAAGHLREVELSGAVQNGQ